MALDIIGPANAPNSVTLRPVDSRTFGASDTWFKDCSSPLLNDGTKVQSGWLNAINGAFRSLIRGNGNTGLGAAIVTEDNDDDAMGLKAIQHLIQRAQPNYANDTGAANAIVVALTPPAAEYKAGMVVRCKVAATNTGATTINVNALGLKNVTRPDGGSIGARDVVADQVVDLRYDGTAFQLVGVPPFYMTAPRDYYVSTVGNDANDGLTAGTSFLTIQRAYDVSRLWNQNGFSITIHVANGIYSGPVYGYPINGSGAIYLTGNVATPNAVTITSAAGTALSTDGEHIVSGIKCMCTGTVAGDQGDGISANGGRLTINAYEGGACIGSHICSGNGATIGINGPIIASGNAKDQIYATVGGKLILNPATPPLLNISAAIAFSRAFCNADNLSVQYGRYGTITNPGNATGVRYNANSNSIINTLGSGASHFPGTIAGTTSTGGQYL